MLCRFEKSYRTADKVQATCDQRMHTCSAIRGSSQAQSAFHSQLYRYFRVRLVFPPSLNVVLLYFINEGSVVVVHTAF